MRKAVTLPIFNNRRVNFEEYTEGGEIFEGLHNSS